MKISLAAFLASVAFISLSGVMMPGPVFAVTLAKGQRNPLAGAAISLGHAVVEFPLVLLIYVGFGHVFAHPALREAVGLTGGVILAVIGLDMIRKRNDLSSRKADLSYNSFTAGILTTLANPYFFLWWATVGATLVLKASAWGLAGLFSFFVVHWLCDFGWSLLVGGTSFKAGTLWSERFHRLLFGACGSLLLVFGAWFVWVAVRS